MLVTFETFKDRETVFRQAKMLKKGANIDVTEDLSKRTRENRAELRKFMRKVRYLLRNWNTQRSLTSIDFASHSGETCQSREELFPRI